jgi:hypothetical protein
LPQEGDLTNALMTTLTQKKVIINKMGKRQGRNGSAFVLSNASLKLAFYSSSPVLKVSLY